MLVSYFDFVLNLSPVRQKSHGIGAIASVQNANNDVAHPTPRARYICKLNSGNAADSPYRTIIAAPAADAPYKGPYESIMKMLAAQYTITLNSIARHWKMSGHIQWMLGLTVQPKMNSEAGRAKDTSIAG